MMSFENISKLYSCLSARSSSMYQILPNMVHSILQNSKNLMN